MMLHIQYTTKSVAEHVNQPTILFTTLRLLTLPPQKLLLPQDFQPVTARESVSPTPSIRCTSIISSAATAIVATPAVVPTATVSTTTTATAIARVAAAVH